MPLGLWVAFGHPAESQHFPREQCDGATVPGLMLLLAAVFPHLEIERELDCVALYNKEILLAHVTLQAD